MTVNVPTQELNTIHISAVWSFETLVERCTREAFLTLTNVIYNNTKLKYIDGKDDHPQLFCELRG